MKKNFWKSVRVKLFLTLCVVIGMIIAFFIIINNAVLESVYYYSKKNASLSVYDFINNNLPKVMTEEAQNVYNIELEKMEVNNNFEFLILNGEEIVYSTNKNYISDFGNINEVKYEVKYNILNKSDILYSHDNVSIRKIKSKRTGLPYVLLKGTLDNQNEIYIRMPITPVEQSVGVSNKFIYIIGVAAIALGGIAITFVTQRFTKPIEELNDIANEMSKLNFKRKYRINDSEDEIDELGKSINTLSDKLEETINQLKINNSELERDIEEKSKIDEMRKQFISDVSHELKTPITSIMGYSDTLLESNVPEDMQKEFLSRISAEANRMAELVNDLLTLSRYDNVKTVAKKTEFDLGELTKNTFDRLKLEIDRKEQDAECLITADVPAVFSR